VNIKSVENIVESFVFNDNTKVLSILYEELKKAKDSKKTNLARRIQLLIRKIPKSRIISSQGTNYFSGNEGSIPNPLYERFISTTPLEEVILNEDAKTLIHQFIEEWNNIDRLTEFGVRPANKLLFFGPPGTGKTKLAYAIASSLNIPLILIRLDEVISSYLGKTGKNIREIFDLAGKEKSLIFLDEIDTLAKHRDDETELGELKRVVTVLLQNIDSFPEESILIGATNHENLLDNAIWRRFPVKVNFNLPNNNSRLKLFELYLHPFKLDVDINLLAKTTKGFSGSMINDACEMMKKYTIMSHSTKLNVINAFKGILYILGSRNNGTDIKTKKTVYNILSFLYKNGFTLKDLSKISSIPYTTLVDNIK